MERIIYSRYLDFNEFKIIFNDLFLNEYDNSRDQRPMSSCGLLQADDDNGNSLKTVQFYDLSKLKNAIGMSLRDISPLPSARSDFSDTEDRTSPNLDIFHDSDDSCIDKDYIPEVSESSTDEETLCKKNIINDSLKKPKKVKRVGRKKFDSLEKPEIEKSNGHYMDNMTHTENKWRKGQYLDLQAQAENIQSGEQGLAQSDKELVRGKLDSDIQSQLQDNETERILMEIDNIINDGTENNSEITKETYTEVDKVFLSNAGAGSIKLRNSKRRRKFEISLQERQAQKKKDREEKFFMKNACDVTCRKKCTTKINDELRQEIHDKYVALSYEEQGIFIKSSVDEKPIQRKMVKSNGNRKSTYVYYFKINSLEKIEVCKKYFLTTLGYKANNDTKIRGVMKKSLNSQKNQRGRYKRLNKIDKEIIKSHILSYNPRVSNNYRRDSTPTRFYLPSDLSISRMYKQFCEQRPDIEVSLEYFRLVFRENNNNISFVHLGNEECEHCTVFAKHKKAHKDKTDINCGMCNDYLTHKKKYEESNLMYQNDVNFATETKSGVHYSVDLQKLVMLPRIDQINAAIFSSRILVFNESFVPLSKATTDDVAFAVLWNETIAGRNQEDIISCFREFFFHKRDLQYITLWLDNNSEKNKNWPLLCFLVAIINSHSISAKTITLQYFEPCNNSMSVQTFHDEVERSLKIMGDVYDFSDFVECVRMTNSRKNCIKIMCYSDFFYYKDFASQQKLKIEPRIVLRDVMSIRVERGLFKLMYKTSHNDRDYAVLDFLNEELIREGKFPLARAKTEPKGIDKAKKEAIISKICPLIPQNRRSYWLNLPTSNVATQ